MRPLALAALLPLVLFATGCRQSAVPVRVERIGVERGASPVAALAGTAWTLQEVAFDDGTSRSGNGATLAFGADGRASARSCNACSGAYRQSGASLRVDALGCTRRGCPAGALELERFLGGPLEVEWTGGDLALRFADVGGRGGRLVLAAAEADGGGGR